MATPPNSPVVNAGMKYVNGLGIASVPLLLKKVALAAGSARDSTNTNDIVLEAPVVIDGAATGVANGLDTGSLGNGLFYAVYVIASSTSVFTSSNQLAGGPSPNPLGPLTVPAPANPFPVAGLLSLNSVQPALPRGYDMFRRVGWVKTDGAANLLEWYQYGSDQTRQYYWGQVIGAGAVVASATFDPVTLAGGVPPIRSVVTLNVGFVQALATDSIQFLPFGVPPATVAGVVRLSQGVTGDDNLYSVVVPAGLDGSNFPAVAVKLTVGAVAGIGVAGYVDYLS